MMLRQRMITGVLLALAVLLGVLLLPAKWFAVVAMVVLVSIAGWEWANVTKLSDGMKRNGFIILLLALAVMCYWYPMLRWPLIIVGVLWWAYVLFLLFNYQQDNKFKQKNSLLTVSAFLVLLPAWLSLLELHSRLPLLVLYLVFLVAIADSAAYFTGKAMGLTPLAPELSPGKTTQGLKGGLFGAGVWALLAAWFFGLDFGNTISFILLSLLVAGISVVGDLYESMLKREAGLKDSGNILPGHGGVLDRVDGLVAALPVFTLGLLIVGGIDV